MSPSQKRAAACGLQQEFPVSERRACVVLGQPRSTQRYQGQPRTDETALCRRLRELVRERPRFGYRRLHRLLRGEGWRVNAKRVHRLCRKEGLKAQRKTRKRRAIGESANACHVQRATRKNQVWSWDFVFDRTTSGTPLKWLSIIDEFTRECLALKVDRTITSEDVIDTLAELFGMRGVPESIRSDNGPEFISKSIREWLERLKIHTLYIAPGSPWQNGYAESFHSKLRDEFLSQEEFDSLRSARQLTQAWKDDYNLYRPHSSLGYVTPGEYSARCAASVRPPASLQQHSDLTQPELFYEAGLSSVDSRMGAAERRDSNSSQSGPAQNDVRCELIGSLFYPSCREAFPPSGRGLIRLCDDAHSHNQACKPRVRPSCRRFLSTQTSTRDALRPLCTVRIRRSLWA